MGYVVDPDLLPDKGGSPGYRPGMQWDVKNQRYIADPGGAHPYRPGMQWRDDDGVDYAEGSDTSDTPAAPAAPDAPGAAPAPTSGGGGGGALTSPSVAGLGKAMGHAPYGAGWSNEPTLNATASALGQRTTPGAVTTLSEIMRRMGRAY